MTSQQGQDEGDDFKPLSLIQYLQLVPTKKDKKANRWEKFALLVSRILRSRFGLRSIELADRYAEARVAMFEGEAKMKVATAIEMLSRAAKNFADAQSASCDSANPDKGAETAPAMPSKKELAVKKAIAELQQALEVLENKGASLDIHLADANPDLPKLP